MKDIDARLAAVEKELTLFSERLQEKVKEIERFVNLSERVKRVERK